MIVLVTNVYNPKKRLISYRGRQGCTSRRTSPPEDISFFLEVLKAPVKTSGIILEYSYESSLMGTYEPSETGGNSMSRMDYKYAKSNRAIIWEICNGNITRVLYILITIQEEKKYNLQDSGKNYISGRITRNT